MSARDVELAAAHARGIRALAEDAREQLARATAARGAAEAALSGAERDHAQALAASSARRDDEVLLDAVSRAAVRLAHRQADHAAAIEAHRAALERHATSERNVEEAARAHERLQLEECLHDPSIAEDFATLGARAVQHVLALRKTMVDLQAALAADAQIVTKARALGSVVQGRDAIGAAGGLAQAILDAGGSMPQASHAAIRWALENADGGYAFDQSKMAAAVVALVNGALRPGGNPNDRSALQRIASLWRSVRNSAEAQRSEETREKAEREQTRRDGISTAIAAQTGTRPAPVRAVRAPSPRVGAYSPGDEMLPEGAFSRDEHGNETPVDAAGQARKVRLNGRASHAALAAVSDPDVPTVG
jgi:hypothetical protein